MSKISFAYENKPLKKNDSPDVGQSAETKTVHEPILLYKIDLLAPAKVD
jgi:hypothetical protein